MKYINILYILLILISSCRADFDFDEAKGTKYINEQKELYNENFKIEFALYGNCYIDPKHTWGFDDVYVPLETKASNTNQNQWKDKYDIPPEISKEESKYVAQFFRDHSNEESVVIDWSDFFVQHVYSDNGNGASHMDWMACGNDEHINNFNSSTGSIMFMENSSTTSFAYHNSQDSKIHREFKILYVPKYDAYYVGFDYSAQGNNPNQIQNADGIYTDWIVKIMPSKRLNQMRVMCEDLGTTDDFDFNDVVFDVAFDGYPGNYTGIITLQAAGGTLPLYVAGHEVHEEFGVDTNVMVNTGRPVTTTSSTRYTSRAPVVFREKFTNSNPGDVVIKVVNNNLTSFAVNYNIDSEKGKIPYKFCVPCNVNWSSERINIKDTYPKFSIWVSDQDIKFWE